MKRSKSKKVKSVKRQDLGFNKKFIFGGFFLFAELLCFFACAILKFV